METLISSLHQDCINISQLTLVSFSLRLYNTTTPSVLSPQVRISHTSSSSSTFRGPNLIASFTDNKAYFWTSYGSLTLNEFDGATAAKVSSPSGDPFFLSTGHNGASGPILYVPSQINNNVILYFYYQTSTYDLSHPTPALETLNSCFLSFLQFKLGPSLVWC